MAQWVRMWPAAGRQTPKPMLEKLAELETSCAQRRDGDGRIAGFAGHELSSRVSERYCL